MRLRPKKTFHEKKRWLRLVKGRVVGVDAALRTQKSVVVTQSRDSTEYSTWTPFV